MSSSIAEKVLNDIRISDFFRIKDLRVRIVYTLFVIVIFRMTLNVPLPFINASVMSEFYKSSGILSMFNMFAGGGLERFSIMSLGIAPYISSSIFIQLATSFIPSLKALKKEGESGQRIINQYTRYLTIMITLVQGYALSIFIETITNTSIRLTLETGIIFKMTTVMSLLVGTLFLMWLGEQITSRGIGNGTSMIIYVGIIASLPQTISTVFASGKDGSASSFFLTVAIAIAMLSFIVFVEKSYKPIHVIYAKRERIQKGVYQSYIPMKINVSNVMPPIFANMILLLPVSILNFISEGNTISIFIQKYASPGSTGFTIATGILIVILSFVYAPIAFDTNDTAENLHMQNAYIQHVRPGKKTAEYLYSILMRLAFISAIYLLTLSIAPDIISHVYTKRIYISGISILIIVNVTLDLVSQIYSYVTYDRYHGLNKIMKR